MTAATATSATPALTSAALLQHPRVQSLIQLCIVGQIRLAEQQQRQAAEAATESQPTRRRPA